MCLASGPCRGRRGFGDWAFDLEGYRVGELVAMGDGDGGYRDAGDWFEALSRFDLHELDLVELDELAPRAVRAQECAQAFGHV